MFICVVGTKLNLLRVATAFCSSTHSYKLLIVGAFVDVGVYSDAKKSKVIRGYQDVDSDFTLFNDTWHADRSNENTDKVREVVVYQPPIKSRLHKFEAI